MPFVPDTYLPIIAKNFISSSGDGIAFVTVQNAQAIQFDVPGEAVRLERAARETRGETFEAALKQLSLLDNAERPTKQLPAIARPQLSAVMVTVGPGTKVEDVAVIIDGWSDVSVFTHEGQRELLLKGSVEKIKAQIGLFRVLLTIIAAIMALILYTLTLDKIHSIALLKDDRLARSIDAPPASDASFEGPPGGIGKAARVRLLEPLKKGLGLQSRFCFEASLDVGPDVGERIDPGTVIPRLFTLRGQPIVVAVSPCGVFVHVGHPCRGGQWLAESEQPPQFPDLSIFDHRNLLETKKL